MGLFDFFTKEKNMTGVKQLGVDEISPLTKEKNYIFIDVREPDEWIQGVIPGVKKVSLGNLEKHFPELDKNAKYVMVCRSGARSGRAAEKMEQAGFTSVINFKGGMLDWYGNKLPLEK